MIEIFRYVTESGREPVTEWLQSLKDKQAQAKIRVRLKRLEAGMFGDCEPAATACSSCASIWVRDTGCISAGTDRPS
jgi:hypothetical protein